jgi:hypothetical protein
MLIASRVPITNTGLNCGFGRVYDFSKQGGETVRGNMKQKTGEMY